MLHIYNTLSKQKEKFIPIVPGKVNMYVCGITVYDYCHIGHGRGSMLSFDMVVRYLRYRGYDVTYVRNITDIDDKIIQRANQNNETVGALTQRFISAMHEDEHALNILPPDQTPRATETIVEMITMIQTLIDKGYAYVATNGDVYYQVTKFTDYGKLSHQDIDYLRSGERVAIDEAKYDPLDFVLWKIAKPGEPSWPSPWGDGRPGWHIECSAMSKSILGDNFDIHAGGLDLQFPHHENEIAQSEAANGCQFANYWLHAGLVMVNNEKMSKSLNNFITIREVLAKYSPELVRYFMLSSHYRSPINYSESNLENAKASLERLYMSLRGLRLVEPMLNSEYEKRFIAAMDDDFNTPIAMAVLFDLVRDINKARETDLPRAEKLAAVLRHLGSVLGLLQLDPTTFLQGDGLDVAKIEQLITARNQARVNKNWSEADRLRAELTDMGIVIEDTPSGVTWRKV